MHLSWQWNCRSLRCSWSIACRRCSNYIFILDLTPGFIGLGKDNCKARQEAFQFGDPVRLILENLRYTYPSYTLSFCHRWEYTRLTNPWYIYQTFHTMHHFNRNVHKCMLQNGALWEIELVHCGICGKVFLKGLSGSELVDAMHRKGAVMP